MFRGAMRREDSEESCSEADSEYEDDYIIYL